MKMLGVPSYYSFHVNNATLACLLGLISSLQRLTYPHTIYLPGFIAKQVPYPLGLYLKQDPDVRTLCHDSRMMVSHVLLKVPFVAPVSLFRSVNPSHQKTEKSQGVYKRYGKFWLQNYKKSSPRKMPKATSLFQPLIYEHKSSALTIADMELENRCSSLLSLGHEQVFDVTAPNLCEPYVSDVVLQQIVCEASTPAQIREANV